MLKGECGQALDGRKNGTKTVLSITSHITFQGASQQHVWLRW